MSQAFSSSSPTSASAPPAALPAVAPALVVLDWGTSSLRAYGLDARGQVVAQRQSGHGITQLPSAGSAGFEQALDLLAGDWLAAWPDTPWLACGMVGSAQGWREVPYVAVPAALADLAQGFGTVALPGGRPLRIVPGLIEPGALPNVMRGEESQLVGAVALDAACQNALVGLPGSHSKWALVRQGRIVHFDTYMTGEAYAALSQHTILSRTLRRGEAFNADAFVQGVDVALSEAGRRGPLSTIFGTRTLGLVGALDGEAQADFLSGLLIGHEVQAVRATAPADAAHLAWRLIGDERLCQRYSLALARVGVPDAPCMPQATPAGLWAIARAAGLLSLPA